MEKKILLLTDNYELFFKFKQLIDELEISLSNFDFACSPRNELFIKANGICELNIKESVDLLIDKYEKIISLHSKQLFPSKLVESIECINVHPGYNPFNRGWYPQVFAIIEDTIIGATIHKMDKLLDHGEIIDRIVVEKNIWDTSETLYKKILAAEMELLKKNLINIISGKVIYTIPEEEGKLHLKKDFSQLCEINLQSDGKFLDFYNILRALSHGAHRNAYFLDDNGNKIYIKLIIDKDGNNL